MGKPHWTPTRQLLRISRMCGRFTLRTRAAAIAKYFNFSAIEAMQLALRFNIAPTQNVLIVREEPNSEAREAVMARWGLIPFWADDPKVSYSMINARAETVFEKRSFKSSIQKRRCLVVADGWYEWRPGTAPKQPYLFQFPDMRLFGFAGFWERWEKGPTPIESCSIVVTAADGITATIHDRMPVIIDPANYAKWLDGTLQEPERIQPMLTPYGVGELEAVRISTFVNNARNEGPECVKPI